jgi:hypothetical protein
VTKAQQIAAKRDQLARKRARSEQRHADAIAQCKEPGGKTATAASLPPSQNGRMRFVRETMTDMTPTTRTNRIIGGVAPSEYLAKLETGGGETPAIDSAILDGYLRSHLIDPARLRADGFEAFIEDRRSELLGLIEQATGQKIRREPEPGAATDAETDTETLESEMTMAAALDAAGLGRTRRALA